MRNKWCVLTGCLLGFSIFHANRQLIAILLPCIKEDFVLNYTSTTFLALAYDVGYLLSLIPAGYLVMYTGKKNAIILGSAIVAVTSLLEGYFTSYSLFIALRVFAGIGFSLYFTSGNSLVADYFSVKERGKAYGIHNAGSSLGQIYGTVLGGTLAALLSWRLSFYAFGLLVLFLTCTISLLLYKGGPHQTSTGAVLKGTNFKVLKEWVFWEASLLQAACFSCYMIVSTFLPLLLTGIKGLTLSQTTNFMSAMLLVSMLAYMVIGSLSDRFGLYQVMTAVFVIAALLCVLVNIINHVVLLVIASLFLGFFMVGNFTLAISLLTSKGGHFSQPMTIGFFNTVGLGFTLLFTGISGNIADVFGITRVFYVAVVIYLIAGIWAATRIKTFLTAKMNQITK